MLNVYVVRTEKKEDTAHLQQVFRGDPGDAGERQVPARTQGRGRGQDNRVNPGERRIPARTQGRGRTTEPDDPGERLFMARTPGRGRTVVPTDPGHRKGLGRNPRGQQALRNSDDDYDLWDPGDRMEARNPGGSRQPPSVGLRGIGIA